jgi:hypothetical protein
MHDYLMDPETNAWRLQMVNAATELSEAATTPIISHEKDGPKLLGMGTIFQIAESKLLVTATHVMDEAEKH